MTGISSFVLFLALSSCTAQYYPVYNASETCAPVASALNDYLWAIDENMSRVGRATQLLVGIDILQPESLDPVICPLIESTSVEELQTQLVETGLVGKAAAITYRIAIMAYAYQQESTQYYDDPMYLMSDDQRELHLPFTELMTHLQEYGYLDFDTISLAVTYGCMVGAGTHSPLAYPPIYPGSLTGDDEQMGEMLWVDIRALLRSIKKIAGLGWPMIKQMVSQYTAGVIDLSNGANMRNLINGIAGCRSEAELAEFLESNFLGPMLNLYFPQLEDVLASVRHSMERHMEYISNLQPEYYPEQDREKYRRMSQAFYTLHDALRSSGFLSL